MPDETHARHAYSRPPDPVPQQRRFSIEAPIELPVRNPAFTSAIPSSILPDTVQRSDIPRSCVWTFEPSGARLISDCA